MLGINGFGVGINKRLGVGLLEITLCMEAHPIKLFPLYRHSDRLTLLVCYEDAFMHMFI